MHIGIIHLTDLHIASQTVVQDKMDSLCRSLASDLEEVSTVFIVLSGDVAYSGQPAEYVLAKSLIDQVINSIDDNKNVKVVMVPGNHDCNYQHETQLRRNTVGTVSYEILGDDDSVLKNCLSVQKDFWEFYTQYNLLPDQRLYYQSVNAIDGFVIKFHCFNTSWMSTLGQTPGSLFFPVNNIQPDSKGADVNISVYHHPINWFTPDTEPNNKREFEKILSEISSIQLVGHEHENVFERKEDFDLDTNSLNFSGKIFHNSKDSLSSGYQLLLLDLEGKNGKINRYSWNGELYASTLSKDFEYNNTKERHFTFKESYTDAIDSISVPLADTKTTARLSDIFVYPHLESLEMDQRYVESYLDSKKLLADDATASCILEGDSQIGKSSLMKMFCIEMYNKGKFPILISARTIKSSDIDRVLKKVFKATYSNVADYDKFKQFDCGDKVLLIDDFHNIGLTSARAKEFIEKSRTIFGRIIISIDTIHGSLPQLQSEFKEFDLYSIRPLGHKKTNDLIVKHHSLSQHPQSVEQQVFLDQIQYKYDQVRVVLGNKVIPSYPIFLLSILQSLENASIDLTETSYGYCYQSLIHYALATKASVCNDDLGTYINFIKELAYYYHLSDVDTLSEDDFFKFYCQYKIDYNILSYDIVKAKLLKSQIIIIEEGVYKFGYKYIYYFLAAKHISDIITSEEGQRVVSTLFENLHSERNANILVFITHHTNDISFINDSLFNAMVPFEEVEPISLKKDDPYYVHLNEISKTISNEIIEQTKTPEEEREEQFRRQDNADFELEKAKQDEENLPQELQEVAKPFLQAFRSIDIVGQIVKNRKGSLKKNDLEDLVSEIYLTGFRTVGHLGQLFNDTRDVLVEDLSHRVEDNSARHEIEQKIANFIQVISYQTCLGVFGKLIFAVGIKDLNSMFDKVADKIGTPAAKLVSFSINSYYNDLSTHDVVVLAKEFKNNPVATAILRSRVRAYIYTNHVNFRKKQALAQALDMKLNAVKERGSKPSLGFSDY